MLRKREKAQEVKSVNMRHHYEAFWILKEGEQEFQVNVAEDKGKKRDGKMVFAH